MDIQQIISFCFDQLQREWRKVSETPITFIFLTMISGIIAFLLSKWRYDFYVGKLKEQVEFYKEQVEQKNAQLLALQEKIKNIPQFVKEEEQRKYHQELIKECRQYLQKYKFNKQLFRENVLYSKLRPHLSKILCNMIEADMTHIQLDGRGSGADNFKSRLLDEIAQLEKKWELI